MEAQWGSEYICDVLFYMESDIIRSKVLIAYALANEFAVSVFEVLSRHAVHLPTNVLEKHMDTLIPLSY